MTPADFLRYVWPDDGLYCIAVPLQKGYAQTVHDTIESAAKYVESIKDAKDIFFCVHSLKNKKIWNPSKGNGGGWSVRTQTNMQEASAFFFDLDVGEGEKKYSSQRDAIVALKQFIQDTSLPYPMVVSSGGGLHVYWVLATSIKSSEWRTYAARLKQLADAYGLIVDPARTTDTASVLRVAGTFNHKRGEKRPVRVLKTGAVTELDDFHDLLNDAIIRAGVKPVEQKPVAAADPYFGEGNLDKATSDFDPRPFTDVLRVCPQARYLAEQRGNVSEPKWQASLNLVRFCINADKLIHKISDQHPDYDRDKTIAKVQRLIDFRNAATGKPLGPTTCKKLAEVCGEERCRGCEHFGKGSSPLWHARKSAEAPAPVIQVQAGPAVVEVEIPKPPKPYTRTADGKIQMVKTNKEGEKFNLQIYDRDLYPVRRMRNDMLGTEQLVWRVTHPNDGAKEFTIDADAFYDRRKFAVPVANAGIYVSADGMQELQNYMIAYIAELQRISAADAQATHLGWTLEKDAFVLADKLICANGAVKPVTLSSDATVYAEPIHKQGTLQRQIELLNFYSDPAYIPNQFVVMAGLAATVFGMTGQHGAIINCTGKAGASKSTTIYTAAALWGHPERYTINGTKRGDTVNRRDAKTAALSNLPICIDEISTIGLDEAHTMAMGISQSSPRGRVKRDGSAQKTVAGDKATIVLSTANDSLHGALSAHTATGAAASMRVIEINFVSQSVHAKWEADEYLDQLKQNYGHVGELFIQKVVPMYDAFKARVRAEMKRIDQDAKITSGERFYSAVCAAIIETCREASRMGLVKYDPEAIRHWAMTTLIPQLRGVIVEEYASPAGVLTDYLEMISGSTLVVQRIKNSGIVNVLKKPSNQLLAHYDYEEKVMYVLRRGFKDHCMKIGADFITILDELSVPQTDAAGNRSRMVVNRNVKKVLGAGTEYGKAQAWCFVIDLKHPDCLGIPDLELVTNPAAAITPPKGELKLIDES